MLGCTTVLQQQNAALMRTLEAMQVRRPCPLGDLAGNLVGNPLPWDARKQGRQGFEEQHAAGLLMCWLLWADTLLQAAACE